MKKCTLRNENKPIIVFGEDWGAHPSSTQHLINELKHSRKIIWINSIGLRKPKLTLKDCVRVFNKIINFIKGGGQKKNVVSSMGPNFKVINPLVFPCATNPVLIKVSRWLLAKQVKKSLKNMHVEDCVIWCSLPTAVDYLSIFKNASSIYYCGDDFGALEGVDHETVLVKEKSLVKKVKYIFTASASLLTKFPKEKVIELPHGVNFDLFNSKINQQPTDLPKGKPIAGFYGSISSWLDQSLILSAAKDLPDWNFIFIGDICCDVSSLKLVDNIHFLGAKKHNELPRYIQYWNVALLPFKDNKQIQMCNPLKLREYIASGTPVVSTEFSALANYKDHVVTTNSELSIKQAILMANAEVVNHQALFDVTSIKDLLKITNTKENREQSVAGESWKSRALKADLYLMCC